jgi:hypothetical protein
LKTRRARGSYARLLAIWCVAAGLILVPASVSAHVNRVVGPYTFLVVLIEEPYFQDNHAGFQFWVRDQDRPIGDLDTTLQASAVGPAGSVPLTIGPRVANGFYQVDFYPGDSVRYSLRLVGKVEDLAIDESFAVVFPTYPRVASGTAGAADPTVPVPVAPATDPDLPLIGLGSTAALAAFGVVALAIGRHRRRNNK